MKLFNKSLTLAAIAAMSVFTACDNYDENERLIDVELPQSEKVVLITEFSGQRCVNCPDGAQIIHNLIDKNPGKVVAIAMHPSESGFCAPIGPDIVTSPIANEYFRYYGSPANFPCAAIDFGAINDNRETWGTAVIDNMKKQVPPATLFLSPVYNEDTRTLTVNCNVEFTKSQDSEVSVVMWITEDGIVGPQQSTSGTDRKYVFNHILRASMNGTWGESIGSGFQLGETVNVSAEMEISEKWNPENLTVVAALLDTRSHAALQATSIMINQ